jgi:hypothetical protein
MIAITNLTGERAEAAYNEPLPHIHKHVSEAAPGKFRSCGMGAAGAVFSDGKTTAFIPAAELWRLVEAVVPELIPDPATPPLTPEPQE